MKNKSPTSLYRIVSILLLSLMLAMPLAAIPAYALTPYTYSMSSDYKNSIYYQNLKSLELTGNGAADVLAVAMSQLGYHEGNSDADFGGGNTAGTKNFVEYNRLYGKLDNNEGNGYSYGYAWCAAFVNWCLRQAGISKSIAGGEASCSRWIRNFLIPNGLWEDSAAYGGSYTPKAGDMIFFKRSDSNALSTHIGLVLYTDGTYVHTVEGNTASGSVALDRYALNDDYVIGYGTPAYESDGTSVCDYGKSGSLAGLYIVTADTLNIREAASASSDIVGGLTKSELVTVSAFEASFAKIKTADGKEGYSSMHYLRLVTVPPPVLYTVTFLDRDGETVLSELLCEEGTLPTPPELSSFDLDGLRYTFLGWSSELAPVTSDTVYTARFDTAELSELPEDTLPPDESENGGTESETHGDESSDTDPHPATDENSGGCGASIGFLPLLLCALTPLLSLPFLRKKTV